MQAPVIERAILHGIGEPLLNRDLPRFVAHLKAARGAPCSSTPTACCWTNGAATRSWKPGWTSCASRIDAVTPDLYARLRGLDQLPRILRNLQAPSLHGTAGRDRRASRSGWSECRKTCTSCRTSCGWAPSSA
jgi:molybdenum cofactor biosynthesis enzyme MoaA